MVFNATFNTISVISLRSVLLVEETGGSGKTTDLSQNHYDDIINVVSCFLCDSANGRTWEMFLLKKTQRGLVITFCSFTLKYLYQAAKILVVVLGIVPKVWWFFFFTFYHTKYTKNILFTKYKNPSSTKYKLIQSYFYL
jgi:hypothetical protein